MLRGCGFLWLTAIALVMVVGGIQIAAALNVTSEPAIVIPYVVALIMVCVLAIPGLLMVIAGKK